MKMKTKSDIIFDFVNYILMGIILFIVLYPLYFVIIASISNPNAVNSGQTLLLPKDITFDGYVKILEYEQILLGYRNSIIYTFFGTVINLLVLIPASFALSRKELVGRKFFTTMCLITMYFGGGMIPSYINIRDLGMMNTVWAIIIPGAFSVYNMIICRSFFVGNVSEELFESVRLDGGSYTTFFVRIVLPLSKAIIAVMVLYHALGHWNSYMNYVYYITDTSKYNLQVVLRNITNSLSVGAMDDGGTGNAATQSSAEELMELVKYSTILIAALPMIILYPFVQKYFVQGVMIGSVKG